MLHTMGQVGCQGCAGEWSSAQTPPPATLATRPLCFQVPCKRSGQEAPCTFWYLKPSTQYCIRTAAVGMAREQSWEAKQCMVTPAGPTGGSSLTSSAAAVASQVLLAAWTHVEMWVTSPPSHSGQGRWPSNTLWGPFLGRCSLTIRLGLALHLLLEHLSLLRELWGSTGVGWAGGDANWGPSTPQPFVTSWQAFPGSSLLC